MIGDRIYPTVEGLTVEPVDLSENQRLLLINIPRQPEEYKPFLVHGAVVNGRTENSFISIVRRRGEGTIDITASQIHAMLVAGRALIQGASGRH